jgi:hypothetical protein
MPTIKIRRETLGFKSYEYKVPGVNQTEASAYYTNDKQDAVDTAIAIHGKGIDITFWNKKN